ncbi:hypothetical protein Tco_1353732 [Tanacetum coccineum]
MSVKSSKLDRLPNKSRVRTDILSRRLKWTTMVTQLVFDDKFFEYLPHEYRDKIGKIVHRLLLHLKGPIKKFVFYVLDEDDTFDVEDIDHWVLFLSRRGIEELTLKNKMSGDLIHFPTQLYSLVYHLNHQPEPPKPQTANTISNGGCDGNFERWWQERVSGIGLKEKIFLYVRWHRRKESEI